MMEMFAYRVVGISERFKDVSINVVDGQKREIGETIELFDFPWRVVDEIQLIRQKGC